MTRLYLSSLGISQAGGLRHISIERSWLIAHCKHNSGMELKDHRYEEFQTFAMWVFAIILRADRFLTFVLLIKQPWRTLSFRFGIWRLGWVGLGSQEVSGLAGSTVGHGDSESVCIQCRKCRDN